MSTIHTNEYQELIRRLKKARIKAGYTQKDVAKKLKTHQSFISKIETFQRRLDILELKTLAQLYKVDISDIL